MNWCSNSKLGYKLFIWFCIFCCMLSRMNFWANFLIFQYLYIIRAIAGKSKYYKHIITITLFLLFSIVCFLVHLSVDAVHLKLCDATFPSSLRCMCSPRTAFAHCFFVIKFYFLLLGCSFPSPLLWLGNELSWHYTSNTAWMGIK